MAGCKGKPAPDIFLQSLQRLNDALPKSERPIEPLDCLVFEDSIAGVEAGVKAGMRVAWVPHAGLLEAFKGREHLVMAGEADKKGIIGAADASDERINHLPYSKNGRVELMTNLEDFPYERYGIELEKQEHAQ